LGTAIGLGTSRSRLQGVPFPTMGMSDDVK